MLSFVPKPWHKSFDKQLEMSIYYSIPTANSNDTYRKPISIILHATSRALLAIKLPPCIRIDHSDGKCAIGASRHGCTHEFLFREECASPRAAGDVISSSSDRTILAGQIVANRNKQKRSWRSTSDPSAATLSPCIDTSA